MAGLRRLTVLLLALAWAASPVFAQSDRGTITGTVTDPTGASVAGAKITATNINSGETREVETSDEGSYTIPELPAGPYTLSIQAEGFKALSVEDVQVAVQVTRRADFALEVGAVTEVVTITDEAPIIQRDTAVRQTNVTEKQVKELPLQVSAETAGRTPLSFIFLDSSVTVSSGSGQGTDASNFKVNGSQGRGQEILIDGASTRRAQNGTFFSEVAPGPNAFQEFTLSTSSYSAEYGQSSGGIVNFTIKSGGNELHGEAYLLARNEALNARTFFQKTDPGCLANPDCARKRVDRQFDFGGNVGGPVVIPGLYNGRDKTFFFFNYEQYIFKRKEAALVTVPTERMRRGDFGELLTDPYVLQFFGGPVRIYDPTMPPGERVPIPGNRLDQYRGGGLIDPVGLNLINAFPLPTGPGVYHNYLAQSENPIDMRNYVSKVDHVLTEDQRVAVSYSYREQQTYKGLGSNPGGFPRFPEPMVAVGVWDQSFVSHYLRAQHDWSITPTLLNHFNFGFTRVVVKNLNPTEDTVVATDFGFAPNATQNRAMPIINQPFYGDPVSSPDPRAFQGIGSTFFSDNLADNTWQFSDLVTWVTGHHTFKFGGDFRYNEFEVHQLIHPGGEFNFAHLQTGNPADPTGGWPLASLVAGAPEWSFNSIQTIDPGWRQVAPAFFVNDDWKITPRLTLNLGVRYDIPYGRTEIEGRFRGFDPNATNPVTGLRGAIAGAAGQGGVQAINERLIETDYSNVAPRIGAAYSIDERTVIRGGFGLYYAPALYGSGGGNDLNEGTIGYSAESVNPNFGHDANFFLSRYPNRPEVNPNGQFIGANVSYYDPDFKTGRTMQWSVDVQRELPANLMVSAGYIGNKSDRQRSNFRRLNALPLEALKLGFPLLNKPLRDVTADERRFAASLGFPLANNPGDVFEGFDGSVAQSLKPFPHYNNINSRLESLGESWYNALQLKLERRFAQGIQFGASYTFSKLLTNAAEDVQGGAPNSGVLQNPYNLAGLKAISVNDVPHVFVTNFLLELPFGSGRRLLDRDDWVNAIVGGWQIGGILRYQAGVPLLVQQANNSAFLALVGFNGNLRPNLVPGAVIVLPTRGAGRDTLGFQYLNPRAFTAPPSFEAAPGPIGSAAYAAYYADPTRFFGNAPAVLDDVRFSGYQNEDFSILKRTRLTETVTLEIGAEIFNAFNRHRYSLPVNNTALGNFGFSSVIAEPLFAPPRSVQLRGRIIF